VRYGKIIVNGVKDKEIGGFHVITFCHNWSRHVSFLCVCLLRRILLSVLVVCKVKGGFLLGSTNRQK
jgi:hypothetical protein